MIIGGVSGVVDDDIISIRMNWAISIARSELLPDSPPIRQGASAREAAWGRKIAPSGSGSKKGMKGRYWSHDIAEWLAQQASPFWNTLRTGGSAGEAAVAYIGARMWQATGGRVVKFVAKQSLRQMVLRPALGGAGVTVAYFAAVSVVAHDIYVALDNDLSSQKFFAEGVKIGGGGFGA